MSNEDSYQDYVLRLIYMAGMEKNTMGGRMCPLLSVLGLMNLRTLSGLYREAMVPKEADLVPRMENLI